MTYIVSDFEVSLELLYNNYYSKLFYIESSDVSVCIAPNGWAWLVHGRRLVIWRYTKGNLSSASSSGRSTFVSVSANCRELTLPPSDLAHNAKLVNVFAVNENQTPSCIAVSPEGKLIRIIAYNFSSFYNIS